MDVVFRLGCGGANSGRWKIRPHWCTTYQRLGFALRAGRGTYISVESLLDGETYPVQETLWRRHEVAGRVRY